jgi:hypothetical protein
MTEFFMRFYERNKKDEVKEDIEMENTRKWHI